MGVPTVQGLSRGMEVQDAVGSNYRSSAGGMREEGGVHDTSDALNYARGPCGPSR